MFGIEEVIWEVAQLREKNQQLEVKNQQLREAVEEAIIALRYWGLSGTDALILKWEELLEGGGE